MTRVPGWRGQVYRSLFGWVSLSLMILPVLAAAQAPNDPLDAPGTLQALKLRGITARPAALMLSGQSGGPIPLALVAVPLLPGPSPLLSSAADPVSTDEATTDRAPAPVAVVVEIPAVAFMVPVAEDPEGTEAPTGVPEERIEMYLYALDGEGKPAASWAQVFRPPTPGAGPPGADVGAKVFLHLELPAGVFELRFLAIALPSGRFGLVRSALEVPGQEAGAVAESTLPASAGTASPLVVDRAPHRWLFVREAPHGSSPASQISYPFRVGGQAFVPAARPVLVDGEEVTVHLLSTGQAQGGEEVVGRIRDGEGLLRGEFRGAGFRTSGSTQVPWQWNSGALQPASPHLGIAQLSLGLGDGETAPLEVVVARPQADGQPILWPDLLRRQAKGSPASGAGSPSTTAPTEAKDRLSKGELRRIGKTYRSVLRHLAGGRAVEARQQLVALESGIVEGRSLGAVEALRDAELAALPRAVGTSPSLLLPIARLHLELLEIYSRDVRLLLAVHARTKVQQLLGLFGSEVGRGEARHLGGDLSARFGNSLQKIGLRSEAAESFRSALDLVPDHIPSLLALGALYERGGQARRAAEVLGQLRQLQPEDAESCLRLGRNLQHQGQEGGARKTFEACTQLQQPAWAVVVAYEELAKLEIADGSWASAEALLQGGVNRFPKERTLVLQWAYVLDRRGKAEEAGRFLAALSRSPRDRRESPRARYGQWPEELFARLSEETDSALEELLVLLAQSLGEPSPTQGAR